MNKRAAAMFATARVVGKIAVQIGWRQTDRTVRKLIGSMTASTSTPDLEETAGDPQLAIVNYQQFAGVDIIAKLESLSSDELHTIAEFENSHRKRRTVLHKIDQLLSTEHFKQS